MLTHSCRGREKEGGPGASAEGKGGPRPSLQFGLRLPPGQRGLRTLASPASLALAPRSPPGSSFVLQLLNRSLSLSQSLSHTHPPSQPPHAPGLGEQLRWARPWRQSQIQSWDPAVRLWERGMPEKNRLRERDRHGESRKAGRETELRSELGKSPLRPAVGLVLEGTPCPACPLHPQQPLPQAGLSSLPSAGPH